MQNKINSPEKNLRATEFRLAVRTETSRWQLPEVVQLKFVAAFGGSFSFLPKLNALESGIPYSPLND